MVNRREQRRLDTRERILDAALRLFTEQDFEATTFDQIAELADVSRQTVFNHFPKKDDFVDAWGRRRRGLLHHMLAEEEFRNRPTADQLGGQLDALAQFNEDERDLTQRVLAGSSRFVSVMYDSPIDEVFAASIRLGQQRGEIDRSADPELAADMLADCYFGTLNRWLNAPYTAGALRQELRRKLSMLLRSLGA
jgi:TetR/AcrR family transcriptional regulator, cholesterol catabolism regulator